MDPHKVAITLICAADDEVAVEPVVERLQASGYEAELVVGVDTEPRRVGDALDRCGDRGMIVACVSKRLDELALRKVEGVFGARRGPHHAFVRVEINQPKPEVVAAIQRAAQVFAAGHGRVIRRATSDAHLQRDVVPIARIGGSVVRLESDEDIDGDTSRIDLGRVRRSVARPEQAARSSVAITPKPARSSAAVAPKSEPEPHDSLAARVQADTLALDRMMLVIIIGAGVVAVIAALRLSGSL